MRNSDGEYEPEYEPPTDEEGESSLLNANFGRITLRKKVNPVSEHVSSRPPMKPYEFDEFSAFAGTNLYKHFCFTFAQTFALLSEEREFAGP